MDIQQVIALLLGAVALYFAGRHVWAEVEGLVRPSKAGGCPGCGGCDAAMAAEGSDPPDPHGRKTPLVPLQTTLPPHLERLRRSKKAPDE